MKQRVKVKCNIQAMGALSAHADQKKILDWVGKNSPKKIYLNHGETDQAEILADELKKKLKIDAQVVLENMEVEI